MAKIRNFDSFERCILTFRTVGPVRISLRSMHLEKIYSPPIIMRLVMKNIFMAY